MALGLAKNLIFLSTQNMAISIGNFVSTHRRGGFGQKPSPDAPAGWVSLMARPEVAAATGLVAVQTFDSGSAELWAGTGRSCRLESY